MAAVLSLAAVGHAAAADPTKRFEIPAEDLSAALKQLALQGDAQIIYSDAVGAGVRSSELSGAYTTEQALDRLLAGTPFAYTRLPTGAVRVFRAPVAPQRPISTTRAESPPLIRTAEIAPSSPAPAQVQPPVAPPSVDTIVVTGSLAARPGFKTPTPVAVLNTADLLQKAPNVIAEVLNEMPQFGVATSPTGATAFVSNSGVSTVNLRNLGVSRTLVLVNGQRVVPYSTVNTIDMNLVPNALIKRVDVVTGGASAAYGSDAVAGVVNLILDTDFVGARGDLQYGNTTQFDYPTYKADLSLGARFAQGRGHVVASFSYTDTPDYVYAESRGWYRSRGGSSSIITNPNYAPGNGQPQMITGTHVGLAKATLGGVITSGPLKGTQFIGNGVTAPFNSGIIDGAGILCTNCDGATIGQDKVVIGQTLQVYSGYLNVGYDLTDNVKASVDLSYGRDSAFSMNYPNVQNGTITIQRDNAFLPPQVVAALTAANATSFQFGTTLGNIGYGHGIDGPLYPSYRFMERAGFNLEGSFGVWNWKAHAGHGETHAMNRFIDDGYTAYMNLAIDAVRAPAGNTAGVAPGTIVCRSTLTNLTNGCVPVNLFGEYVSSDAAKAYISPQPHFYKVVNKQDDAQFSIQGTPFSIWAGPLSVAAGGSYRNQSATGVGDPLQASRGFYAANSANFSGAQHVWEGFGEVIAPLLAEKPLAKEVVLDAAGRLTDYSTSGLVETWKLGLTDQITDEYRLRGTWSYDIRAPNLNELFSGGSVGTRAQFDPLTNTTPTVQNVSTGNPDLTPEKATTLSAGIVWSPDWMPGLRASLDWYNINIKDAIATVSNAFTLCNAGQTFYCALVVRNGALAPNGIRAVSQVFSYPLNTSQAIASGVDGEIEYTTRAWGGNLTLHATGSYIGKTTSVTNGQVIDNAGSLGNDTVGGGEPRFKANVSATYRAGGFSQTIQTRFIGAASVSKAYTPAYFPDNHVPPIMYLDLRGSFDLPHLSHTQAYYAIDNVFNTAPPWIPGIDTSSGAPYYLPTRAAIYDALGRRFRVGVRFTH